MTNSVFEGIKHASSLTTTDNGDLAHSTTYDNNLDFFFSTPMYLGNPEQAVTDFVKAFTQNKALAIKNLFYLRDIKGGQGIRTGFRAVLSWLAQNEPVLLNELLPHVVTFGRWDDILHLALKDQGYHEFAITSVSNFVDTQLANDLANAEQGKPISLLAKWLPKVNSKSPAVRKLGYRWANILYGGDLVAYRLTLKGLREHYNLVETNLSTKTYGKISYESVPAKASVKYRKAFHRNDAERYLGYLTSLADGSNVVAKEKLAERVKTLYPYEIIRMLGGSEDTLAEEMWSALPSGDEVKGNTLVVYDGSSSMGVMLPKSSATVAEVAQSLAIYTSERVSAPFKDKVIEFSRNPQFIDFEGCDSLSDKVNRLRSFSKAENTDISKVYDLIFEASLNAKPEDYLDKVLIVTDCQFDPTSNHDWQGVSVNTSTYEVVKRKFAEAGIPMPTIVYWNLNVNRVTFPTTDIDNVMLVSGFSANVMSELMKGNVVTAVDVMLSALDKYGFVDGLNI